MPMQPGERITLIKAIASALSEEKWPEVELALREFKVAYDEEYRGGLYEMVLDAGQGAQDDDLVALHSYLYPDAQASRTGAVGSAGGPWDPDAFRLFISHTHPNRKFAGQLRTALGRVGIDCFVAHDTIEPTREWLDEIESALNTCDALVAMLTDDFVASKWCDQEVGFCVARAVPVISLRMPADPHGFIGKYQGLAVAPNAPPYSVAPAVFDLLAKHELTRSRMVRPIVQRYIRSGSFDATRAAYPLLVGIAKHEWTDQLVQDVLNAAKNNAQVEHANLSTDQSISDAVARHLAELGVLPAQLPAADDDIPF